MLQLEIINKQYSNISKQVSYSTWRHIIKLETCRPGANVLCGQLPQTMQPWTSNFWTEKLQAGYSHSSGER